MACYEKTFASFPRAPDWVVKSSKHPSASSFQAEAQVFCTAPAAQFIALANIRYHGTPVVSLGGRLNKSSFQCTGDQRNAASLLTYKPHLFTSVAQLGHALGIPALIVFALSSASRLLKNTSSVAEALAQAK